MKKILLFLFLAMPLMGFAQKSYITLNMSSYNGYYEPGTPYLTGDVTDDLSEYLDLKKSSAKNFWWGTSCYLGEVLNKLSEKGYEIEYVVDTTHYILSKRKDGSGSSSYSKIQSINTEDEGEPYEVARYNLQGIPVKSYEKGIQIIVFSNYTTKTVIVE